MNYVLLNGFWPRSRLDEVYDIYEVYEVNECAQKMPKALELPGVNKTQQAA